MIKTFTIKKVIENYHNNIAITSANESIHYPEFYHRINIISNYLANIGINYGERITILGKNSTNYSLLIISLIHIGAIPVPLNIYIPMNQIKSYMKKVDSRKIFISGNYYNTKYVKGVEVHDLDNIYPVNDNILDDNLYTVRCKCRDFFLSLPCICKNK